MPRTRAVPVAASPLGGNGMLIVYCIRLAWPALPAAACCTALCRLSWIVASPTLSAAICSRNRSMGGGCTKATLTLWPPTKSTPKLRPRVKTSAIAAAVTRIERTSAKFRYFMNARLVLSGTSFSRRMSRSSNMQFFGPRLADPERDHHAGDVDRGEHRGERHPHEDDGKATHRPRAEIEHQHGRDDIGDVRVENGGRGLAIARFKRVMEAAAPPLLLPDAFVDQHVRVHRRADRQHEAGDARQRQGRLEQAHDADDHQAVQDQADRRID